MTEEQFLKEAAQLDSKEEIQPEQETETPEEESQEVEHQKEGDQDSDHFDIDGLSEVQKEAYEMGWRPKEQFKGDPENWTSAKAYIQYQKLNRKVAQQKIDFDKQLKENNEFNRNLYKSQIEILKKQLEQKRDLAVEEGDLDGFKENQKQLDDIVQQEKQYSQPKQPDRLNDPAIDDWINRNPWIAQDTPKSRAADAMLEAIKFEHPELDIKNQLEMLDERLGLAPKKPALNPRRSAPSLSEQGTRRVGSKSNRDLTMSDLTQEERDAWRLMGKSIYGGDEKKFLKSVKNSRA